MKSTQAAVKVHYSLSESKDANLKVNVILTKKILEEDEVYSKEILADYIADAICWESDYETRILKHLQELHPEGEIAIEEIEVTNLDEIVNEFSDIIPIEPRIAKHLCCEPYLYSDFKYCPKCGERL